MKTLEKIELYLETLGLIMITLCFIVGTDYEKLNNTIDILTYVFIVSNLLLWSFYYIQKFYKVFSNKENKE